MFVPFCVVILRQYKRHLFGEYSLTTDCTKLITFDDAFVTFLNVSFIDDLKPFLAVTVLVSDPVELRCSSGESSTSFMKSSSSSVTSRLSMLFAFINCLSTGSGSLKSSLLLLSCCSPGKGQKRLKRTGIDSEDELYQI